MAQLKSFKAKDSRSLSFKHESVHSSSVDRPPNPVSRVNSRLKQVPIGTSLDADKLSSAPRGSPISSAGHPTIGTSLDDVIAPPRTQLSAVNSAGTVPTVVGSSCDAGTSPSDPKKPDVAEGAHIELSQSALKQIGVESPREVSQTIREMEKNRWCCPELDTHGWHPQSGTTEERQRALKDFSIDLSKVKVEDMKQWYQGTSPWHAAKSSQWTLHKLSVVKSEASITTIAKAMRKASAKKFHFYDGFYEEKVKLPMFGVRTTKWLVCCYVSPIARLVRCIDGFIGKDEAASPFALATLRVFTVPAQDGDMYNEKGLSFWPDSGSSDSGCKCVVGGSPEVCFELNSPCRGWVRLKLDESPFKYLQKLGPGFWNLRTPFKMLGGMIDIGNHMSFLQLDHASPAGAAHNEGAGAAAVVKAPRRFLCVDAVDPLGPATNHSGAVCAGGAELKEEIDRLTLGGRLIEAVVATHPFHTLGFLPFFQAYGAGQAASLPTPPLTGSSARADATGAAETAEEATGGSGGDGDGSASATTAAGIQWFGTPRHVRCIGVGVIPWHCATVDSPRVQSKWAERGVHFRLPPAECSEFNDPKPAASNHFCNLFAFHERSKCVHNDDCLCYCDSPLTRMGKVLVVVPDVRHDALAFHMSMQHSGLRKTPEAPGAFASWLEDTCDAWPFECLCSAHNGVLRVGANARVRRLIEETRPKFAALSEANAKAAVGVLVSAHKDRASLC